VTLLQIWPLAGDSIFNGVKARTCFQIKGPLVSDKDCYGTVSQSNFKRFHGLSRQNAAAESSGA
jgi:hypothetical protein